MINFIDHLHFYSCEWLCVVIPVPRFARRPIMLLRRPCMQYHQLVEGGQYFVEVEVGRNRKFLTLKQFIDNFLISG